MSSSLGARTEAHSVQYIWKVGGNVETKNEEDIIFLFPTRLFILLYSDYVRYHIFI